MAVMVANSEAWPGLEAAVRAMRAGRDALDVVEEAIRLIEAEPLVRSVGRGGRPNMLGVVEVDASIMDGRTLRSGAVGAVKGCLYPISAARKVMELLPHVFLVGEGAERFAREVGVEFADLLTAESTAEHRAWMERNLSPSERAVWSEPDAPLIPHSGKSIDPQTVKGTTSLSVLDTRGAVAAGVSTSGWAWKHPGRIGDSPVIGAGCYADNAYGAATCIGAGEMAIRACTARAVVLYMKMGMTVEAACREAARDLGRLRGGTLTHVVIHAMSRGGRPFVLWVGYDLNGAPPPSYYYWDDSLEAFDRRAAEVFEL